jgi:hypothetical protein
MRLRIAYGARTESDNATAPYEIANSFVEALSNARNANLTVDALWTAA